MLRGDPKYRKKEMDLPATFVSDAKELRLYLIPVESETGPDNTQRRKANTGCRLKFEDHRFLCENKALLKLLLNHKNFNMATRGFRMDPEDPNGFWRAAGKVRTKEITVIDLETVSGEVTFKDLDFKKINEAAKKTEEATPV